MFLAQATQMVEVTGSQLNWPTAVCVCVLCIAVAAIVWAIAWSMKND